jgi:hypothetical protein
MRHIERQPATLMATRARHRYNLLRLLFHGAGAANVVPDIKTEHGSLIRVTVKTDQYILRIQPVLDFEVSMTICKAVRLAIASYSPVQNAVPQLPTTLSRSWLGNASLMARDLPSEPRA